MANLDFSNNAKGGDRLSQVVSDSAPLSQPAARTRARNVYTPQELSILRREYPHGSLENLSEQLGRSQNALAIKAQRIGLQRFKEPSPNSLTRLKQVDPLIILLRDERRRQRLGQEQVGRKAGFHHNTISVWELGVQQPRLTDLRAWAQALGRDIQLSETVINFPSRDEMVKRWMGRRA